VLAHSGTISFDHPTMVSTCWTSVRRVLRSPAMIDVALSRFGRARYLVPWLLAAACGSTTGSQQGVSDSGSETDALGTGGSSGTTSSGGSSGGSGSGGSSGSGSGSGGSSGSGSGSGGLDAGTPDSTSEAAAGDAGTCATCGAGSVCVEDQTLGGARIPPDDAGQCPPGLVIVPDAPSTCSSPPTFHCAVLPSTCTTPPGSIAVAHCTCAASLCAAGDMCTDLTPTLMRCVLAAP
jgi:hypothetical protein